MLNLGCDCGVCFLNTLKSKIFKKRVDQKNKMNLQLRFGLLGGCIGCLENLVNCGVEYRDLIDFDGPSIEDRDWFMLV